MVRFNNDIDVDEPGSPYGAVERSWGIGKELHNLCEERASRTGNPNPGTGRALAVHHHGMASLAPFDGWAEDVHCYGEQKDHILPGSRAAHFWFHDHALGTTSENVYAGLEAIHFVTPCKEPYNMQNIPQYVVHYLDAALDESCQLRYDKPGSHFDNLFGDVNLVNGVRCTRNTVAFYAAVARLWQLVLCSCAPRTSCIERKLSAFTWVSKAWMLFLHSGDNCVTSAAGVQVSRGRC